MFVGGSRCAAPHSATTRFHSTASCSSQDPNLPRPSAGTEKELLPGARAQGGDGEAAVTRSRAADCATAESRRLRTLMPWLTKPLFEGTPIRAPGGSAAARCAWLFLALLLGLFKGTQRGLTSLLNTGRIPWGLALFGLRTVVAGRRHHGVEGIPPGGLIQWPPTT